MATPSESSTGHARSVVSPGEMATEAGAATAPALRLAQVSKTFGGIRALKEVSFEVLPGEVHCLAGENGSGKSTLIKIITGVYTPDHGADMAYFGRPVEAVTPG